MWRVLVPRLARLATSSWAGAGQEALTSCSTSTSHVMAAPLSSLQHLGRSLQLRHYSLTAAETKEVEEINDLFVEARDEIEMAQEDSDTVYFNESVTEAKLIVDACVGRWEALLAGLDETERGRLQRSMGLKMEQLKAEFDILAKTHLED